MKKATNKKGFTIVELVIVIAVIAILAAVLIPTFSSVIKKAKKSSAQQKARNALTVVIAEKTDDEGSVASKTYYFKVGDFIFSADVGSGADAKLADVKQLPTGAAKTTDTDLTGNEDLTKLSDVEIYEVAAAE